ncbi:hypothetical protein B5M42_006510 [Paenibacillus athensensis]|uniref:Uncharacterized protein n=1 Tax=Paenibacillus athensensis TaxID=1967502 RepID=A0A4Y8Q422_9BACL|nr:hypothetical protein [Paenibacillus athensensis]MCD1258493.1 hypothetical protein [Paenibacillus athensensis]
MAEKNILAYFHDPAQAEAIAMKLKTLRAADVQVDRISAYPGGEIDRVMNPINGDVSSLATLTQGAELSSVSDGILIAASPAASGMSDGGDNDVTGRNILLTAVVDETIYEQAMRVIQDAGGSV